ncbi:MAG TPA: DUF892 family protein [Beijerinckiaceae bacterium]|jgi:ferritin-like metal-binding protein YciE
MPEKNLNGLFVHTLKDVYFAEQTILKTLPKYAEAAQSEALKEAFETHGKETSRQIERLKKVFKLAGAKEEGEPCEAMQGLVAEGEEILEEFEGGGGALDAGLIAAAQAIEHYEIARYGTLVAWADQLGMDEASTLLKETLAEEESTDELLSELAEDVINPAAV